MIEDQGDACIGSPADAKAMLLLRPRRLVRLIGPFRAVWNWARVIGCTPSGPFDLASYQIRADLIHPRPRHLPPFPPLSYPSFLLSILLDPPPQASPTPTANSICGTLLSYGTSQRKKSSKASNDDDLRPDNPRAAYGLPLFL